MGGISEPALGEGMSAPAILIVAVFVAVLVVGAVSVWKSL
jgi:hypothetical protein